MSQTYIVRLAVATTKWFLISQYFTNEYLFSATCFGLIGPASGNILISLPDDGPIRPKHVAGNKYSVVKYWLIKNHLVVATANLTIYVCVLMFVGFSCEKDIEKTAKCYFILDITCFMAVNKIEKQYLLYVKWPNLILGNDISSSCSGYTTKNCCQSHVN
jgi:hypothetical protein